MRMTANSTYPNLFRLKKECDQKNYVECSIVLASLNVKFQKWLQVIYKELIGCITTSKQQAFKWKPESSSKSGENDSEDDQQGWFDSPLLMVFKTCDWRVWVITAIINKSEAKDIGWTVLISSIFIIDLTVQTEK